MRIYIAAPLFNEGERALNEKVDAIVRDCGHETFLPQREGGCVADLPDIMEGMPKRKYLFQLDCANMDRCDAVLFLFDGRVPDEGACFELGYCYAKGKRCIAYKQTPGHSSTDMTMLCSTAHRKLSSAVGKNFGNTC